MHQTLSAKLADFGWEVLCMPTTPNNDLSETLRSRAKDIIDESSQIVQDVTGSSRGQNTLPANTTLRRLVRNGNSKSLGPFKEAVAPFHSEATELLSEFVNGNSMLEKEKRSTLMGALSRYSEFLATYRI